MTDTPATTRAAADHGGGHEHGEAGHDEHGHGEFHLPPNSWSPISMAFALTCTFIGFVTAPLGPVLWIIGLIWTIASGVAWYLGARNEFRELPD